MQIGFFDVFISVVAMMVMAIPGFIFGKTKLLPESATATCSSIVLYCCQSAMVFMSFQSYEFNPQIGLNMLLVGGLSALAHFVIIGLGFLIIKGKTKKARCMRYANVFGNCGFMGLPFLQMLFNGSEVLGEMLIYAAVILSVFNLLNWTLGVLIMTGDAKMISVKKIFLNPVIISLILGVLCFVILKKPIVAFAEEGTALYSVLFKLTGSVKSIGDMVTPLSMFVIGIRLSSVDLKSLFLDLKAYAVCFVKLAVMPIILVFILAFLPIAEEVKYVLVLLLSMPCATSVTLFAVSFDGDGDFGAICVLLSTVLSIITIPLIYLAFTGILGLV